MILRMSLQAELLSVNVLSHLRLFRFVSVRFCDSLKAIVTVFVTGVVVKEVLVLVLLVVCDQM